MIHAYEAPQGLLNPTEFNVSLSADSSTRMTTSDRWSWNICKSRSTALCAERSMAAASGVSVILSIILLLWVRWMHDLRKVRGL